MIAISLQIKCRLNLRRRLVQGVTLAMDWMADRPDEKYSSRPDGRR